MRLVEMKKFLFFRFLKTFLAVKTFVNKQIKLILNNKLKQFAFNQTKCLDDWC